MNAMNRERVFRLIRWPWAALAGAAILTLLAFGLTSPSSSRG